MLVRLRRQDQAVFELFDASGRNVQRATALLVALLADYPEHKHLSGEILDCEHEGDRLTQHIIQRLNRSARAPLDPADGLRLATAVDDIVDFAEEAADALGLYNVEAPMEQAGALAEVLAAAGEHVSAALAQLREGTGLGSHLEEIHRLEHEGDRLSRAAVAALFATGVDPMLLIRWKDIFGSLESSVDACDTVANVIEGINLKRRRRR
jgi:predicted phosphate transport protein (TIGR00153 family)